MEIEDAGKRVNDLVAAWIVRKYRSGGTDEHLRACPDAVAETLEGGDRTANCDTGCSIAQLTAEIVCTHGARDPYFEYAEYGDLPGLIAEIEAEDPSGDVDEEEANRG